MAARTSTANGNWSSTSTWTGGFVPGAGDTATISHAVVVDVNTTIGAGNGIWVSGGNAAAIQVNGTGNVTIATGAKLTCRGDFACNGTTFTDGMTAALVLNAGSTFEFDSSTTAPTSTAYRFMPLADAVFNCGITANGTSGSHATIQSNAGGANGYCTNNGHVYYGNFNLTYTDFLRWGNASNPAIAIWWNYGHITQQWANVTFDTCGPVHQIVGMDQSVTNSWANVVWKNSLGTYNTDIGNWVSYSGCVFDKPVVFATYTGTSMTGCYFGAGISSTNNSAQWTAFSNNVVRLIDQTSPVQSQGDMATSLVIADYGTVNPHYVMQQTAYAQAFSDLIFEYTSADGNGDCLNFTGNPAATQTYTVRRCLTLPNAGGDNTGTLCSLTGTFSPNGRLDLQHCTYFAGTQGATYNETGNNTAGTITAWKNNIAWDTVGSRGAMLRDVGNLGSAGSQPTDVVSPANGDYNCGYNLQQTYAFATWYTNQGKGYEAKFSSTPGAHDLAVNPNFVDSTRNTATFDTAYLANAASATWASQAAGHTFAAGDIISNNNGSFYGGALVNFRCISSHLKSAANSEPGAGSSWRTYWELASVYRIRTALQAGTTITDSSLSLSGADYITALRTWITKGFAPKNATLKAAASDAGDIGAVAVQLAATGGFLTLLGIG